MPTSGRQCSECGSPLARDQHYCLVCGARAGDRDPKLTPLLAEARKNWPPRGEEPASAPASAPLAPAPAPARSGLRLPSARVSALLVAAFLGFGVVLGSAAATPPRGTLAADTRAPLRLVLPSTHAATGSSAAGSASSAGSAAAPPTEPESTPSPAPSTPAPAATSTNAHAGASTAGSGEGEGGSSSGSASEGSSSGASESTAGAATKLPPIKHVFVIVLSDEPYATSFGPASSAHYLSQTLEKQGELLVRYDAVAHEELPNLIALVSGQGPTPQTQANCPTYGSIEPATPGPSEQVLGSGCIYPASTHTLPGELAAKHLASRSYVQGIDEAGVQARACAHPALGQADPTADQESSTGPYATFRNPFVYFHALADSSACASEDVGMTALVGDLAKGERAPNLAYVLPGRCDDGNPTPCTPGAAAGMGPADSFLTRIVPEIEHSAAYRHGGLIVITTDEAPSKGEYGDSSSCCGQPASYPNLQGTASPYSGHGGGTVGALLISPYVKGGTTNQEQFDHYSLLRTIEDLFSVRHLGYSGLAAVKGLPPALFTAKPTG